MTISDLNSHVLKYRAGTVGLSQLGILDDVPHWWCTCGQWRINRNIITGSPQKPAAQKKHHQHIEEMNHRDLATR